MTTTESQVCRITVLGPTRKADLAVPIRMTVAHLIPALLQQTEGEGRNGAALAEEGSWVLQRLGQAPFELSGTPETLDWLEGEQLHLRPAEDPLPDIHFDDLPDGVATMVNRRDDRWKPEYRRNLFLVLSAVAMVITAYVMLSQGPVVAQVAGGGIIAAGLLAAALIAARRGNDPPLALLLGGGSMLFAAAAAASTSDGRPDGIAWTGSAVLSGSIAALAVAALLVLARFTVAPSLPIRSTLIATLTMAVAVVTMVVGGAFGMRVPTLAGVMTALLFGLVVMAPRIAVKLSRLRGPQLPKTGEDMTYDIEPEDSETVRERTDIADAYLTVSAVTAALTLPVLFQLTLDASGWGGWTLVLLVANALLLRSRGFFGLWQRVPLVFAGVAGDLLVARHLTSRLGSTGHYVLLLVLIATLVPLAMAAMRPWPQRMLPFWEYTATFFDVTTAAAVLPVLGELLGWYSWARGLFG
jgi:type VII secretion integral membrane protein EccD